MSSQDGTASSRATIDPARTNVQELSYLPTSTVVSTGTDDNIQSSGTIQCLNLLEQLEDLTNDSVVSEHQNSGLELVPFPQSCPNENSQQASYQQPKTPPRRLSSSLPNQPPSQSSSQSSKQEQEQQQQTQRGRRIKIERHEMDSDPPAPSTSSRGRGRPNNPPLSRSPPISSCEICGCPKWLKTYMNRAMICQNCTKFLSSGRQPQPCTQNRDCPLVWRPFEKLCPYCRMRKAVSLGLAESIDPNDPADHNRIVDEDVQLQMAIEASLRDSEDGWEDYALFYDVQDVPKGELPAVAASPKEEHQVGASNSREENPVAATRSKEEHTTADTSPKEHPAGGIFVEVVEDTPPPIDEYGLPLNIRSRYSRWWYSDFVGFQPGDMTVKRRNDEIRPPARNQDISISNDISDLPIKFITQDLDEEEPEPVEEVITPVVQIRPSPSFRRALECQPEKPITAGDVVVTQMRPKVTLRFEIRRTVIDRRPMLKKLKSGFSSRNTNESNGVSTTSLIGPGEDCDESDDSELPEVDCESNSAV